MNVNSCRNLHLVEGAPSFSTKGNLFFRRETQKKTFFAKIFKENFVRKCRKKGSKMVFEHFRDDNFFWHFFFICEILFLFFLLFSSFLLFNFLFRTGQKCQSIISGKPGRTVLDSGLDVFLHFYEGSMQKGCQKKGLHYHF